jgi:hypothetical protein
MKKLRANRERGALALYTGKPEQEAMAAAGLKWSPANGRRFRNSPDVRARLKELFEQDRLFYAADALRAVREREHVAYARISNYYEDVLGEDGKPTGAIRFKGFARLTDQEVAAIASIKPTKTGYEIKLHDKNAALHAIQARVDPLPLRLPDDDAPGAGKSAGDTQTHDADDSWDQLVASRTSAPLAN